MVGHSRENQLKVRITVFKATVESEFQFMKDLSFRGPRFSRRKDRFFKVVEAAYFENRETRRSLTIEGQRWGRS
jgi:hypothetical protein